MVSASEIRGQIAEFLANRIDLDSFEDWVVQHTWNVHQSGSVAAEDVTFAVEEALSEYSNSQIGQRQLRSVLGQILSAENKVVTVIEHPQFSYIVKSSPSVRKVSLAV
jgi:hypothetical protein